MPARLGAVVVRTTWWTAIVAVLLWGSETLVTAAAEADSSPAMAFERDVAPLLAQRCLGCHSGTDPQGQLDLTSDELAVKGGESGSALTRKEPLDSPLWRRVAAGEMPPEHPLPDRERAVLREWLSQGAIWPQPIDPLAYSSESRAGYDWWAWQPIGEPTIPMDDSGWSRSPLDAFVAEKRAAAGLTSAHPAARAAWMRRLSFDLLGLPPSPSDVAEFVQDDSPLAEERLVDRLLASPHYGERWARHWLDVVRFGESNGFERDLPRPSAWHYRDWVIQAFNADLPYDEFVRWQLAGDSMAPEDPTAWQALGFLVAGPHDTVVPVVDRMKQTMRQDELEDLLGTVGQTFLGLTIHCARCHDHKFDPISTTEYYQLSASLAGVNHAERRVMPPALVRQQQQWQAERQLIEQQLRQLTSALFSRKTQTSREQPPTSPSTIVWPEWVWDFRTPDRPSEPQPPAESEGSAATPKRETNTPKGQLAGTARMTPAGLLLDGQGHFASIPLQRTLTAKTLEVRVTLANLDQRGGGALTVQTLDGHIFDSIVFGEGEPQRWMAGSNFFERTQPLDVPTEYDAAKGFITLTWVYAADGTITAYRDGKPFGRPYRKAGAVTYPAGQSQVLVGLRHGTFTPDRALKGVVAWAKLYDDALTAAEVQLSAATDPEGLSLDDLLALMTPSQQQQWQHLQQRRRELTEQLETLERDGPLTIYTAAFAEPGPQAVLRRGDVSLRGAAVQPRGLAALRTISADWGLSDHATEPQRRARLADWITDRQQPLFPRVMVNRLWQYHFGLGLLPHPNDFGFHGGRPTHPELLDWLAGRLRDSNYSLKRLQRDIVTSATYRQSSQTDVAATARDAENRWLWRVSPRRIEAEAVRDAMLTVSGLLNDQVGGPSYSDFYSHFFKGTQFYEPRDLTTADHHRRTVYRMHARGGRNPWLDTFDCPDPSTTTPRRSVTTTPLQALSLMNHTFVWRVSDQLAQRVVTDVGTEPIAQVERLFELLYLRRATPEERQLTVGFLTRHGLVAVCRGLLNSSEWLYVD
jgi:hypothetical protein